ncbi:hypothetical protein [Bacillus pretiosus]|uniref:HNH nuclease domain-containing protein n=1 Tax=Bacillus pretiosus TaxID=2983392 RepID=A0ABT3EZU3_9BACI|nr:hypothetical protein [Bacillus pretiosus]MCW1241904.1 hypothetical protein [Bacillus pretiosus]
MARKKIEIVTIEIDGEFVEAKECTKCGEVKALSEYHRRSGGVGNRRSDCKVCKNRTSKEYLQLNKDEINSKRRNLYKSDGSSVKERNNRYYRENRDIKLGKVKEHYFDNREEKLNYAREYRKQHAGEISEKKRQYRKDNKELHKVLRHVRKARMRSLPSSLTSDQVLMLQSQGCFLTKCTEDLHLDHFIPLAWGHGGTIIENMIPLSASLNTSKKDANPFEWIKREDIRQQIDMKRWHETIEYLAKLNDMTAQEYEKYVYWCEENKRDLTIDEENTATA